MRVLQIGSDRSRRGILIPGSPAFSRQEAYAKRFGTLDIIGFSKRSDDAHTITTNGLSIYPTNSASSLMYGLDAIRIAARLPHADVVSAQDPFEAGLVAYLIAWMNRSPLYIQVHTDFLAPEYAKHSLLNRVRVVIAGFIIRRAHGVRVVSETLRRSIEERYHPRASVTVLPIYLDTSMFQNARIDPKLVERFAQFKTKILVVSRLEPEKNVALAVESFAEVAPPDACLIIVGAGSEAGKLKRLVHENNNSDRIFFEGEKPAIDYYPLADIILVTSRYEGYGLVIVEAIAAGKPVLSTDVGVAREMGAIVADEKEYPAAFAKWFTNGPRTMQLKEYPYKNFDDYVERYCADIVACIKK